MYRESQKCLVMSSSIRIHKRYHGKKLYYKYMILGSNNANPQELLYMYRADVNDCKTCFRVLRLPTGK